VNLGSFDHAQVTGTTGNGHLCAEHCSGRQVGRRSGASAVIGPLGRTELKGRRLSVAHSDLALLTIGYGLLSCLPPGVDSAGRSCLAFAGGTSTCCTRLSRSSGPCTRSGTIPS